MPVEFLSAFGARLGIALHHNRTTIVRNETRRKMSGVPRGIRTPVASVKGWCPRPD